MVEDGDGEKWMRLEGQAGLTPPRAQAATQEQWEATGTFKVGQVAIHLKMIPLLKKPDVEEDTLMILFIWNAKTSKRSLVGSYCGVIMSKAIG